MSFWGLSVASQGFLHLWLSRCAATHKRVTVEVVSPGDQRGLPSFAGCAFLQKTDAQKAIMEVKLTCIL